MSTFKLTKKRPYQLENSLFCGQAFRWTKHKLNTDQPQRSYFKGVIGNHVFHLQELDKNTIFVKTIGPKTLQSKLKSDIGIYLGLCVSLKYIINDTINTNYKTLAKIVRKYKGLSILRQNNFEVLISFMCAQGLGLGLIRDQISRLCSEFGNPIINPETEQVAGYSFPTPESLAYADIKKLRYCTNNNKIRATNIKHLALAVSNQQLILDQLFAEHTSYDLAKKELVSFPGIGEKIADCICLFGLGHHEAIPIDRHVREYLKVWFGLKTPGSGLSEKNYRHLAYEARKLLGPHYPGLLSQILFHYWRKEVKGLTSF